MFIKFYFNIECDNTKCGTCSDFNTCITPCKPGCSTCDIHGNCTGTTCKLKYTYKNGECLSCYSSCTDTCDPDNTNVCLCRGPNRSLMNNCDCLSNFTEIAGNCE